MKTDIEAQPTEQAQLDALPPAKENCKSRCARWKYAIIGIIVALIGLGIGFGLWLKNRPVDIEVVQTTQTETSPSVVKVAPLTSLGANSAVLLESTSSLIDDATFYYVRLADVDPEDIANVDLVLTTNTKPTSDDLSNGMAIVVIEKVASVEFPYRLEGKVDVSSINGAAFVENGTVTTTATFDSLDNDSDKADVSLLPVLESSLSGNYGTQGTIRIEYANEFVDGEIKLVPRLRFDLPNTVSAPGPFLYISKRPFSESQGSDIASDDIFIPLDESTSSGGSFNVKGKFEQVLDEVALEDIADYANGSWVVWCRPFGVYIGGGSISEAMSSTPDGGNSAGMTNTPDDGSSGMPSTPDGGDPGMPNTPDDVALGGDSGMMTADESDQTNVSRPPVLESSLSGNYGTQGTIRIEYANEFVDGEIKLVPRLRFDLPNTVSAPGPFLYISKRPFSESRGSDIASDDIFIPLDESASSGGSFNVKGKFEQVLNEVALEDIADYANGSWVVWCRPFGVYIGGGSISEAM